MKIGEGNRTPVTPFCKNAVLPLNYTYSRGYGADGSFLLKRPYLNCLPHSRLNRNTTHHGFFINRFQSKILRKIKSNLIEFLTLITRKWKFWSCMSKVSRPTPLRYYLPEEKKNGKARGKTYPKRISRVEDCQGSAT